MVPAFPTSFSFARRFAHGPASAFGFAAMGFAVGLSVVIIRAGSDDAAGPLPPRRERARIARQFAGLSPAPASAPLNRRPEPFESADWIVRTALCVEPREGRLMYFHAAGGDDGRLSGIDQRGGGNGRDAATARSHRRQPAAARSPAQSSQNHSRPRRGGSQPSPCPQLGRIGDEHHHSLRGGAPRRGWARKNS